MLSHRGAVLGAYRLAVVTGMPLAARKGFLSQFALRLPSLREAILSSQRGGREHLQKLDERARPLNRHYKYRSVPCRGQVVSGGWRGHGPQPGRMARGTAPVWVRCQGPAAGPGSNPNQHRGPSGRSRPTRPISGPLLTAKQEPTCASGTSASGPSPAGFRRAFRRRRKAVPPGYGLRESSRHPFKISRESIVARLMKSRAFR